MTINADGSAIWFGTAKPHGWLRPPALEVRTVDTGRVEPCPGTGHHVVVAAADDAGWVSARLTAGRRSDAR